ncbi:MAG: Mu transposase C-terminal domain-containing protein [Alloacidobacterium sp.]|jgi:putative transposase
MQKWRNWEAAGKADWLLALKRESVIAPLAVQPKVGVQVVDEAALELGLGRSVTYELLKRYRQRSQTSSLLPGKRGREPKAPVLDQDREDLLSSCIQEFYLKPERPRLAALMLEIRRRFAERNLRAPNYRTVLSRIQALDLRMVTAKREGSKKARELLGPIAISTLQPERPMDVLQIDHTPVDVIVVDQQKRLPIGRPWLTLAIDVRTRMVAGFHVSLWAPSTLSLSLVLSQAVLPKTSWLADRELQTLEWPVHGLPRTLHVDNAKEFHAEALVRGCQEYGIRLDHRPPGQPHFGGHIERLIGTMMGAVHLLPGTTFSSVSEKGSYASEERASLTLAELERWLALQIAGIYHLSIHSALGKTPLAAWQEDAETTARPRNPLDETEFFLSFLPAVPRQIRRDGIHFHNIRYWDNVLSPWAGRLKEPLLVKYDPRNLSRIYVQDPCGRHWPVPYADLRQPPIALWEIEAANKQARQDGRRMNSAEAIFANVLEQRQLVRQAGSLSKQRRRQEKLPSPTEPSVVSFEPRMNESRSTEIKAFPVEIWESE